MIEQNKRFGVALDDKWTVRSGCIFLSGTQAIARVLLAQKELDQARGLNTAGYISGYRGSPLGGVDLALWSISDRLERAKITFAPGVNEDLAATAVRGTQQIDAVPNPLFDGVFAAWYGKGPGVDRSGDALKHGNYHGAHPNGGVMVFYGDDHGGKSSSVAHHSEQAMAAALIPSFYPADVGEIIEYGLLGYALSRYSGAWVGMKLVNEVAEQTATVDLDLDRFAPILPATDHIPPEGVHARQRVFAPLREEQIMLDHRLPMVHDFVRANGIDRTIFRAAEPLLGLVTAGKSHGDTMQALALLGLDTETAATLGLSLFKLGCIWPVEPSAITRFSRGHRTLFVIEEKQAFVEPQIAALLINEAERPRLIGKCDEDGQPLLPQAPQLDPGSIALAIVGRLRALERTTPQIEDAAARIAARIGQRATAADVPKRSPFFCSGCPHSRSTRIPEGSVSMTGIGCHTMAAFARPEEALPPTHMGAEGLNWAGLAPFTGTRHIFQNMGDGTYYHSGLLAIRAAVASGANITYKILYNDAVAMTGGQPVDGPISVPEIARQVKAEGVKIIRLVSDRPELWRGNADLPADTTIHHRDDLDAVQRELREIAGCSVLIYEQTCAAEKRRRRKRGRYPDPAQRLFIAEEVCEGCGDCSAQSTCVSLMPVETEQGTKRKIDQSSCNKDYSCLNGFCPSFLTIRGAALRKPKVGKLDDTLFAGLPEPHLPALGDTAYNIMIAGIGGTGVITVAAVIAMAAHMEGRYASAFDMTGLSQKNGAVFSHLRIGASAGAIHAQKLGRGEADVLLGMDAVAALADDSSSTVAKGRTSALVSGQAPPTAAFQFDRDANVDVRLLLARLKRTLGEDAVSHIPASALALRLLGDTVGANMLMVGAASQRGLLPVGPQAIEQAIRLNGTAVPFNLDAFRLGRLLAFEPDRVAALMPQPEAPRAQTLGELVESQALRLADYQNLALAARYRRLVETVAAAEARVRPGSDALAFAVARTHARVLSYKDEYEVARLLSSNRLWSSLSDVFAEGGKVTFNLAPPVLPLGERGRRPRKREFNARLWRPIFRLLAHGKGLRGTRLDPFGYFAERKAERALVDHYEELVTNTIEALTPDNLDAALRLIRRVDQIRGFGPVKDAALIAYYEGLPRALADFAAQSATHNPTVVAQ
ncbi:indolepyruvate ferredoxin oxidoreductase family protein [Sphingopyxis sp. YR583]|uniref:indolepyruvate ferredoxin oxidoreductase family protein n=1 Tax=Sphingopyxis sp. YR583 TaxID=1881047 RepID=UPI002109410A|nr:indolepyruvate ferredoxin oxidoreductase family protein [Sphingopyxis sp. YR583]